MSNLHIRYSFNGKLYNKEEWDATLEDIKYLEDLPCDYKERKISVSFGGLAQGHEGPERKYTLYELMDGNNLIGLSNMKDNTRIFKEFRVEEGNLVEFSYDDFLKTQNP